MVIWGSVVGIGWTVPFGVVVFGGSVMTGWIVDSVHGTDNFIFSILEYTLGNLQKENIESNSLYHAWLKRFYILFRTIFRNYKNTIMPN